MSVQTLVSLDGPHLADGINRLWDFDMKVLELAHLQLLVTDNLGVVSTVTGGFTATGIGAPAGGTVTYPILPADPLPAGYKVVVQRLVPLVQGTSLGNQSAYFPKIHEDTFDRLTMQIQQVSDIAGNSLFVPLAEGVSSFPLPPLADRAGRVLGFDVNGVPVAAFPTDAAIVAGNVPAPGAPNVGKYLRALSASTFGWEFEAGGFGPRTDIASAATVDLGTIASHFARITGVVTITSFGNSASLTHPIYRVKFGSALQVTASANIVTPTGLNIAVAAGDAMVLEFAGAGVWVVLNHQSNPNLIGTGRQTMWIAGSGMNKNNTLADPALGQFVAASFTCNHLIFTPGGLNDAHFHVAMPKSWDLGNISCKAYWQHPTTVAENCYWQVFASAYGDGDLINGTTFGSTGASMLDASGTANQMRISPESTPFLPGNVLAANDFIHFIMRRNGPDAADTLSTNSFLYGLMLFYNTNINTDT